MPGSPVETLRSSASSCASVSRVRRRGRASTALLDRPPRAAAGAPTAHWRAAARTRDTTDRPDLAHRRTLASGVTDTRAGPALRPTLARRWRSVPSAVHDGRKGRRAGGLERGRLTPAGASVEWHDAWFDLEQRAEDCRPTTWSARWASSCARVQVRLPAQEILPDGEGLRAVTHIPLAIVERMVRLERSVETTDPIAAPHLASG
jgi:hypothetical protein